MTARPHPALARRAKQVAADRAHARRRMACAAGAAAAGALVGWWLITGPVFAARSVNLATYDGPDRAQLERALTDTLGGGSLLRPPVADLRATAQTSAWVSDVIVSHDWPFGVAVEIIPARPVAVVTVPGGESMLVSGRGQVMGPSKGTGKNLAKITASAGATIATGGRVPENLTAAVTFTTALDGAFAGRVRGLRMVKGRLEARIGSDGPRLIIGPPHRLVAKATALTTLLSDIPDDELARASYINITLPDRPSMGDPAAAAVAAEQVPVPE